MSASCRYRIVFSLVSVLTAVALSAHAEEPPKKPAGRAAVQAPRPGPGGHPGPMVGPGHPGPMVGRGRGAHFARGASLPARNFGGHPYRGRLAWEGGRWHHEVHNGRDGYWWDVGGVWYFYPQPMDGPPTYISEDYADDVDGGPDGPPVAGGYPPPPGAYGPPPGAYAPPPPPPPPDPAASAVGGAIVGGVLGGLLTGRASCGAAR